MLRSNLRASVLDGGAFSLMVGIGETYLPAFVLALGLGEAMAGLVAAVPMLGGSMLQMAAPWGVRRLGSLKRWVVACALMQAVSLLPLVFFAVTRRESAWAIFLAATVYWASGLGVAPAWNTWMGALIPRRLRAHFFGRRVRITQACLLSGLIAGGLILQQAGSGDAKVHAFAALFGLAMLSRLVSARYLAAQTDVPLPVEEHRVVSVRALIRRASHSADGRLVAYLLALQTTAQLASPFFTPYMLEKLRFPYALFMIVLATSYLTKVVASPLLGRLAARHGARLLLRIGGAGIVPLAWVWTLTDDWRWLLLIQVVSGLAWGSFEIANLLMFFETIREEERTSVLTAFNFLNALATVVGASVGAWLLGHLGETKAAYHTMFTLSTLARATTLILQARVVAGNIRVPAPAEQTLAVRPALGSIEEPILSSLPGEAAKQGQ